MNQDRLFAFKVAMFNSVGFCLAIGIPTYCDHRISTHIFYPARVYPLGYWILLSGPPLLFAEYWCLRLRPRLLTRVVLPASFLLVFGFISLFFFKPEFPHGNLVVWIPLYAFVSTVTCWIRDSHASVSLEGASEADRPLRIERIKEWVTFWRTISLSTAFGYLALILPWNKLLWEFPERIVKDPTEVVLVGICGAIQLSVFSTYVAVGPVYESFRKTIQAADALWAKT